MAAVHVKKDDAYITVGLVYGNCEKWTIKFFYKKDYLKLEKWKTFKNGYKADEGDLPTTGACYRYNTGRAVHTWSGRLIPT